MTPTKGPHPAGMSPEEKAAAIMGAKNVTALDALWAEWEKIGYSTGGRLYALVLARRQSLAKPGRS